MSPPARIASSSWNTSDLVRVTGISLQRNLAVQPKMSRWPTSVVDPGFYTTWGDVNAGWSRARPVQLSSSAGRVSGCPNH
jgi:hypothetical protein